MKSTQVLLEYSRDWREGEIVGGDGGSGGRAVTSLQTPEGIFQHYLNFYAFKN